MRVAIYARYSSENQREKNIIDTLALVSARARIDSYFGRGRIRTHGPRKGTAVFKTAALGHSATLPLE